MNRKETAEYIKKEWKRQSLENGLVPMPDGEVRFNASNEPCDMKVGPCSCGAWHRAIYTFHRAEGFYPLELVSDEDARDNALRNPGTLKVVNEATGEIVWLL